MDELSSELVIPSEFFSRLEEGSLCCQYLGTSAEIVT